MPSACIGRCTAVVHMLSSMCMCGGRGIKTADSLIHEWNGDHCPSVTRADQKRMTTDTGATNFPGEEKIVLLVAKRFSGCSTKQILCPFCVSHRFKRDARHQFPTTVIPPATKHAALAARDGNKLPGHVSQGRSPNPESGRRMASSSDKAGLPHGQDVFHHTGTSDTDRKSVNSHFKHGKEHPMS